jgi:hypothetical protein
MIDVGMTFSPGVPTRSVRSATLPGDISTTGTGALCDLPARNARRLSGRAGYVSARDGAVDRRSMTGFTPVSFRASMRGISPKLAKSYKTGKDRLSAVSAVALKRTVDALQVFGFMHSLPKIAQDVCIKDYSRGRLSKTTRWRMRRALSERRNRFWRIEFGRNKRGTLIAGTHFGRKGFLFRIDGADRIDHRVGDRMGPHPARRAFPRR